MANQMFISSRQSSQPISAPPPPSSHGRPLASSRKAATAPWAKMCGLGAARANTILHPTVRSEALNCKLCEEPFQPNGPRTPVVLPCSHTFCRESLHGWSTRSGAACGIDVGGGSRLGAGLCVSPCIHCIPIASVATHGTSARVTLPQPYCFSENI